jgi:hypothetical protein
MAYGNTIRAYPNEKLTKIKGWRDRGLAYWEARHAACSERVRTADGASQLGRALDDRAVAECAVRELRAALTTYGAGAAD